MKVNKLKINITNNINKIIIGGNVSAHTSHLLGSALCDPYLAVAGAINGLAGPLHGLANQECLRFLQQIRTDLGDRPTDSQIEQYVTKTINSGKVIPGYGHAVLRNTDPRFIHLKNFASRHIKSDPLVDLTAQCFRVIPKTLDTFKKIQNPYPNVDCHSGVLLNYYGMNQYDYYTVVFAVSRTIGCVSGLVWSRIFGLPIERPNALTIEAIQDLFENK